LLDLFHYCYQFVTISDEVHTSRETRCNVTLYVSALSCYFTFAPQKYSFYCT